MFKQFNIGEDVFVGVDLADHPADKSVETIFRRTKEGKIEIVSCSSISVPFLDDAGKAKYFEDYEKFCAKKAAEQKSIR